ncbi:ATP-binding protein [Anoxybacillus caldiproteolyticus]|nr:ATP-binding protein [Anoxybacillus caldiproteolyticus]
MAGIFKSFFRRTDHSTNHSSLFCTPDLPLSELLYRTKRGFLARKLGQYIGMNSKDTELFLYDSLINKTFKNASTDEARYLLYLSESLLEWGRSGEDIPAKVNTLNQNTDIINAMLKAYDIYKDELFGDLAQSEKEEPRTPEQQVVSDEKWEVYRDVIYAATQEKFLLIKEEEIEQFKKGKVVCEEEVKTRSDIPKCRNLVKEIFEEMGISKSVAMSWLLVVSEAITNIIKHAEEGKMTLVKDELTNELRFIVEDKGPGFSVKELPKTTLLAGYSTKKSLGQGFTLMMKIAKKILLFTSPRGSTLILIFELEEGKGEGLNATG